MAVARVLPWRRNTASVEAVLPLIRRYHERWPRRDTDLIRRAYKTAEAAHEGQRRKSGEPYILHPLAVAMVVADLGLDDVTIAAALLHDAVEDTGLGLQDVEASFGADVAAIVDGVTKLDRLSFESREAQQSATMRKMLVAVAKDLRVLLIKLADRLHNLRTIGALRPEKQERIARESLDIYAPLAHRLGMQDLRQQLEDLSFAALYPRRYAEIDELVAVRTPEQDRFVEDVLEEVREQLDAMGVKATVTGRHKHLWSIYEKMVVKGRSFDDIFDLVGIRVIVASVRDCYAALGCIHATWKPVPGRFKDYIAMPKFNLYQSLHTTVVGPRGASLEVQIRTEEMHHTAEFGVAAHWRYKDGHANAADIPWLNRIIDWQADTDDPAEFMETLRVDLEADEVFVFTPKGDVLSLPVGATPIDFAYTIHTDVGHATIGAKVNGRLVPLDRALQSGDTVEIFTSKVEGAGPSRDWFDIVVTPRARNKVRQWFARERRVDAIETGREELLDALRRENLPSQKLISSEALREVGEAMNHVDLESLYAAVGERHISAKAVAQRLARHMRSGETEEALPTPPAQKRRSRRVAGAGVHVEGLDDIVVRVARCCSPVPGDEIMGFVTRGRGVSVHRTDCANAVSLASSQGGRLVDVEWDHAFNGSYVVSMKVRALDRSRLLQDVSSVLADHHVNILGCTATSGDDQVSVMRFEFELGDPSHLGALLASVRRVPSVFEVEREMPRLSDNGA
jgi:GTP pyrophosphokinase